MPNKRYQRLIESTGGFSLPKTSSRNTLPFVWRRETILFCWNLCWPPEIVGVLAVEPKWIGLELSVILDWSGQSENSGWCPKQNIINTYNVHVYHVFIYIYILYICIYIYVYVCIEL
jgi:hypothetical protein